MTGSKIIMATAVITLLARLLSLINIQVYMAVFGPTDDYINIYSYALNIPNIMFNMLGTFIVAIVVPLYSSLLVTDKIKAKEFISSVITFVFLMVLALFIAGFLAAGAIAGLFPYSDRYFLIYALRIMLGAMFLYGFHYIFQGILHSHGKFLLPAFVAAPSSLFIIGYVLFFGKTYGVNGLLYATLIGLSLQGLILFPSVLKLKIGYKLTVDLNNPEIKQALKLAPPVLVSVFSFQITSFFNSTMAFQFNMVTLVSYTQNLMLVTILSLVYSLTAVYLPKLTRLWQESKDAFKSTLEDLILILLFFLIPSVLGFVVLSREIIELLAHWGDFGDDNAVIASTMLALYGLSIVSIGLKELMDRAYYAQKNSIIPGVFGFLIMTVNIVFTLFTINYFGFFTMPVSYFVSTTIGTLGLILLMHKKIGLVNKRIFISVLKFVLSAFLMAGALYFIMPWIRGIYFGPEISTRMLRLALPAILGATVYFGCALVFKVEQLREVMGISGKNK